MGNSSFEAGHAEIKNEAVVFHDVDGEADRVFFAGGFDHDIGQFAAVDVAQGVGREISAL